MDNLFLESYLYLVKFHGLVDYPTYHFDSIFCNSKRINFITTTTPDEARHYIYYGGRTTISNPFIILTIPKVGEAHIQSLMMLYRRSIDRFDLVPYMLKLALSHTDRNIQLTDNFIIQIERGLRIKLSDILFIVSGCTIYENSLQVIPKMNMDLQKAWREQYVNKLWKDIIPASSPLFKLTDEHTSVKKAFHTILNNREMLKVYVKYNYTIINNIYLPEEWKYIRV
jgi:hypothetical protein